MGKRKGKKRHRGFDGAGKAQVGARHKKCARKQLQSTPGAVKEEYVGARVNGEVERVDLGSISAKDFFDRYVQTRQPVILTGSTFDHIDPKFKGGKRWTNSYLKSVAGESSVRVEYRSSSTGRFGLGKEKTMKFKDFIELVEAKNDLHYLTTQDLKIDEEGRPELMSSPITELFRAGDFPLSPTLLPSLVLFNANLWFGNAQNGSSSGLHHDFHDNLYILLRGKKQFRLFSPSDALKMYTVGNIVKVHSNGRINYEGEVTRADGADPTADKAASAAALVDRAEKELEDAEASNDPQRIAEAEKKVDQAMDAVLSIQMEGDVYDEDHSSSVVSNESKDSLAVKDPVNFCRVNLNAPVDETESKFPLFKDAAGTVCEVRTGEALYLPAGWFHEVTSINVKDQDEEKGGHMAFNYWFHPPDRTGEDAFLKPYSSNFWAEDFKTRVQPS